MLRLGTLPPSQKIYKQNQQQTRIKCPCWPSVLRLLRKPNYIKFVQLRIDNDLSQIESSNGCVDENTFVVFLFLQHDLFTSLTQTYNYVQLYMGYCIAL